MTPRLGVPVQRELRASAAGSGSFPEDPLESRVLELLSQGQSNKHIAYKLVVSEFRVSQCLAAMARIRSAPPSSIACIHAVTPSAPSHGMAELAIPRSHAVSPTAR